MTPVGRRGLRLRGGDWIRLTLCSLLIVVTLALECELRLVREFFSSRALLAGVTTGALLGVFAVFGFQAARAKLNDRRWAPLSRLALLSLSNQTTLLIDVALWLATGRKPVNTAAPDSRTQAQLNRIRGRNGLSRTLESDLGKVLYGDYSVMLSTLVGDPQWRRFAIHQWDKGKWRNREGIAIWSAAMLTTGEAADVLNRLAKLNEWVAYLQRLLRGLGEHQPPSRSAVVHQWLMWHAEATSLREDLVRAARQDLSPEWKEFRNSLRPEDITALERRHATVVDARSARRLLREPYRTQPAAATAWQDD
jgi:hypothetical protein